MTTSVLICPDSFKGSATAAAAAQAIADGWLSVRPDDHAVIVPMADGGEGTAAAIAAAHPRAEVVPVRVTGPAGEPVDASWLRIPGPDGDTGVVEFAHTSGLGLAEHTHGMDADSRGFGEAIAAALDAGVHRLVLALGGSATSDGGAGILTALAAQPLTEDGLPIAPGNRGLAAVRSVDLDRLRGLPPGGAVALTDVRTPLLGPTGAVRLFGPQKGVSGSDGDAAEANMRRWVEALGTDPDAPGAGAAGGAGYAMLAWGADVASGAEAVADLLDLRARVREADAVVTGEGRFDDQSSHGKVVSAVQQMAREEGVPVMLAAGRIDAPTDAFAASAELVRLAGSAEAAMAEPERWLAEAGRSLASERSRHDAVPRNKMSAESGGRADGET